MHAARALNAQRKRRQEQRLANVRRLSAVSGSRSPIDSTDLERLEKLARRSNRRNASGVNCAYVGFALAICGSIPLVVGTFIEIPALWEVGLTITIVGLLLGIVFWCSDFLREAKGVGPVIPKPKPHIDKAKVKDLMHKPPAPLYLNVIEKDEVMAVEIPTPYSELQSRSEPILTLQSSEPKPFLGVDYLPQQIPEPESPKQMKQFLHPNSSYPNHIVDVEPDLEPYPKNSKIHGEPESYQKVLKAQVEPSPKRESEPYSEIDMTQSDQEPPEPEPMHIVQIEDNEFRESPSPALTTSTTDTTVQIISSETNADGGGDEPIPKEKETSMTSEISPVDFEPSPPIESHPAASPPKSIPSSTLTNTVNDKTESEFSSVPGTVPDQVIQIVEVIPSLTTNNDQQKTEEKTTNE